MKNSLCRRGNGLAAAAVLASTAACWAGAATPDMAVDVRAGTTGIGVDYDVALSRSFSARVGYSGFKYDQDVDTSEVHYSGDFKLSMVSAVIDWYAFHGGFHVSAGAIGDGTRLDVVGHPAAGSTYTLNGHAYSAADVGSLTGRVKFGNPVSPYVGIGWGDPVGANGHLHFLFDVGAIYGGTPNVTLTAVCGRGAPAGGTTCRQLQPDVQAQRAKLAHDVTIVQWYPVLDLGLAYRF
ncbi:MAG: hypothetical protein ACREU2_17215 [Steroidobacteraceae bacterium]